MIYKSLASAVCHIILYNVIFVRFSQLHVTFVRSIASLLKIIIYYIFCSHTQIHFAVDTYSTTKIDSTICLVPYLVFPFISFYYKKKRSPRIIKARIFKKVKLSSTKLYYRLRVLIKSKIKNMVEHSLAKTSIFNSFRGDWCKEPRSENGISKIFNSIL